MKISTASLSDAPRHRTLFIALFQKTPLTEEEFLSSLPPETKKTIAEWAKKEFRGEEGEIKSFWLASGAPQRIVLFGLGEKPKWNGRKEPLIARRMAQYAKRERIAEFATPLPPSALSDSAERAKIFAANALMAQFDYTKHKEKPPEGWPEIKSIALLADTKDIARVAEGIRMGIIIGEEVNACRNLANTPGSEMTPSMLAEEAGRVGRKNSIRVKILEERDMKRLGMGGILGVAAGSQEKPKFIILEYLKGPRGQKPLALIGKGVTFDTGGLNIKPDQYMYEMHMDMSGGGAVIHGVAAISRLKLPVSVVGIIPAVENMPSGSSYRPGDMLKSMSGKTIEVLNTDAEGRIILADGLWYGMKKYNPGLMVDFATLTGAAHVALGNYCSALFTNREALELPLRAVGDASGDYVWPLPLWDEYFNDIKGIFGDVANTGTKADRYGGAIHGAKFLEQIVGDTAWAHLDIAPKMTTIDSEYLARGASGVGVRYIVELTRQYPNLTK